MADNIPAPGVQVAVVARSGTVGVCSCHRFPIFVGGSIVSSLAGRSFNAENLPVATRFSIVRATCGHSGIVISSSRSMLHGGIGIARQFDTGVGCYNFTIVNGGTFATKTSLT